MLLSKCQVYERSLGWVRGTERSHPAVIPGGRRELFLPARASRRRRPRSIPSWGDSSRSQAVARARDLALLDR